MAMTQEEVFGKVRDVLVDALGVDGEEVTPEAKLVAPMMRQTTSQSSLYGAKHGNLYRMPRILSISVSPLCMEVAGPAIVQYLADHGVGECDYSLTSSGPDGMLEED